MYAVHCIIYAHCSLYKIHKNVFDNIFLLQTRDEANVYPRKTSVWHKGKDKSPVRRIVNQQKTTTDSRQSTPRRAISSQSRYLIARAK